MTTKEIQTIIKNDLTNERKVILRPRKLVDLIIQRVSCRTSITRCMNLAERAI